MDEIVGLFPVRLQDEARQQLLAIPVADQLPPYTAVLTDIEGMLWIVLSVSGDARTHLRALRDDGKVLGDVQIPKSLVVLEVGSEYVLGLRNGEDGEQHILLYRLNRDR